MTLLIKVQKFIGIFQKKRVNDEAIGGVCKVVWKCSLGSSGICSSNPLVLLLLFFWLTKWKTSHCWNTLGIWVVHLIWFVAEPVWVHLIILDRYDTPWYRCHGLSLKLQCIRLLLLISKYRWIGMTHWEKIFHFQFSACS